MSAMRLLIAKLVKQGNDLSSRQLHVMFECVDGEKTVKQLFESGEPGIDKPAVTRAVDRLVSLGYTKRLEHPTDRRSVLVSLTREGKTFMRGLEKMA